MNYWAARNKGSKCNPSLLIHPWAEAAAAGDSLSLGLFTPGSACSAALWWDHVCEEQLLGIVCSCEDPPADGLSLGKHLWYARQSLEKQEVQWCWHTALGDGNKVENCSEGEETRVLVTGWGLLHTYLTYFPLAWWDVSTAWVGWHLCGWSSTLAKEVAAAHRPTTKLRPPFFFPSSAAVPAQLMEVGGWEVKRKPISSKDRGNKGLERGGRWKKFIISINFISFLMEKKKMYLQRKFYSYWQFWPSSTPLWLARAQLYSVPIHPGNFEQWYLFFYYISK